MKYIAHFLIVFSLLNNNVSAGVMPSRTRVVYTESNREQSLMLANTNRYPVIVQTWIDNGEGTPDVSGIPFISVPPVFRLEPHAIKGVRIIYNGRPVRRDRESLYWFNIYEIPPERKDVVMENGVLVTMNTQIKLFYRPSGVITTPEQAISAVTCHKAGIQIMQCYNPSPIHLSVIAVQIDSYRSTARALDSDLMIPPLAEKKINLSKDIPDSFSAEFRYVNDSGDQLTHRVVVKK
ncbi:molecular chaperone [Pantoea sp. NSTU24]|uniref:fimbrial biogenesis chaperone n=1 Tax=Pantoea sp. NSTU24 TaxID=3391144 RepID=UPI003D08FDED